MNILGVAPMLTVAELDPAIGFYRDVLGFECKNSMEGWACMASGDTEVMLTLPNAHLLFDRPHMTGSLYFSTDNVDEWWERLKDKCQVEYPVENFEYGMREFAIRGNSGYLLQFGQSIDLNEARTIVSTIRSPETYNPFWAIA